MFQILIVEDDKELSQLFQKVLEKNGYQVKSASDGALALEILDKEYIEDVYKRQSAAFFGVDALQKALDRTDSRHKKVGAAERKCGCSRCGTDAVRSLCVG